MSETRPLTLADRRVESGDVINHPGWAQHWCIEWIGGDSRLFFNVHDVATRSFRHLVLDDAKTSLWQYISRSDGGPVTTEATNG